MLLKKILRLKKKVSVYSNFVIENKNNLLKQLVDNHKKSKELSESISSIRNQLEMQTTINNTLKSLLDTQQKEKDNLTKDMQILVVALKDIYSFVEENSMSPEVVEELINNKLKNITYH